MNSNTWKTLYNEKSEGYEWMVQHEDYEHNLLPALNEIHPLKNANVVEFGAGTGRITAQLIPLVRNVWAFDITPPMVQVASKKLKQSDWSNWLVGVGDSRAMPVPTASPVGSITPTMLASGRLLSSASRATSSSPGVTRTTFHSRLRSMNLIAPRNARASAYGSATAPLT